MNILFLHSSSDLYGASKILLAVTGLCKKQGHEVTVVLSDKGPLSEKLEAAGIEVIVCRLGILRRKYIHPAGIINRFVVTLKAYAVLKRLCRQKKINLIYSNTAAVTVGGFVARAYGIRHIWHVHEIIEKPALFFRFSSWLFNRRGNEILAVSEAVKSHWSRQVQSTKIKVLYNGVDLRQFENNQSSFRKELSIDAEAILIGMIGRVHFWKGQDYFLRIAGILHRACPQLTFVLVGDAFPGYEYLYQELDAIIKEEGLEDAVKQVRFREDIANIYHALDIFILPSLLPDPAPAVVTEAMASAVPVVVTQQGGAVEMVEAGVSGILIPINDPTGAAEKILPLIKDASLRKRVGRNAHSRVVQHFSREVFNTNIMAFINQ